MSARIADAYPARARFAPGADVRLDVELVNDSEATRGRLEAELREHGEVVARASAHVEVPRGESTASIAVPGPRLGAARAPGGALQEAAFDTPTGSVPARGYEVIARLRTDHPDSVARTAALVAAHWRDAPRYGFLSEFPAAEVSVAEVRELAKFHVTVVQFYDWMYRHYAFVPPEDVFEDAMGRKLSLSSVRARVAACHEAGMAAMAYGAVYGAEPEFVDERPAWVLRDAAGEPLSLIDLFYITDLRPGSAWREHILREFEVAVRDVGFDGIHMDQYGFPKWSYDANGDAVRLDECFPGLIDEAAARVADARDGAAVLFNSVNDWPVDLVAPADQAAVYIEVWPPHDTYRDLVELVRRARDLSGKQVVLAAYLEPFRDGGEGAEHGALFATAAIACAGGHHLLLGEGHGVLRDPYYPNHGTMSPTFARRMRRYYDHTAAHHRDLFAPEMRDVTTWFAGGINEEVTLSGAALHAIPTPGGVWVTVRQSHDRLVVNLVNLTGVEDCAWNRPKAAPQALEGLELRLSRHFGVGRAVWSSPDGNAPASELQVARSAEGVRIPLPRLELWSTLVVYLRR